MTSNNEYCSFQTDIFLREKNDLSKHQMEKKVFRVKMKFVIDVKLAQHDELPRREREFHWSKNQPIRKSKNQKHHYRG